MPVYEYECQACKYYMEVMQKITDAPLIKCPSCGKRRLKRLVSAPVFRLKGAGWYETDFKSDKEAKRNLLTAEEKEAAKADAKPEAKEETAVAGKEIPGKEEAGKEASGKDATASKDATGLAPAGTTRRDQSKGAARGGSGGAGSGASKSATRSLRHRVRSGRSSRRKSRRGRR